jgi:hypothetical protein
VAIKSFNAFSKCFRPYKMLRVVYFSMPESTILEKNLYISQFGFWSVRKKASISMTLLLNRHSPLNTNYKNLFLTNENCQLQ